MNLHELRRAYERRVGSRDQLKQQIARTETAIKAKTRELKVAERSQDIVRAVALETQAQLEYRIASTISAAQESVFDDPYGFAVKFEERRGKTECDLLFEKDRQTMDPLASSGYGAVDVASFALRISAWSMSRKTRPVLLLDEPFRFLSTNYQPLASEMVKKISQQLGLQMLIITHEEQIMDAADKVFRVSIKGGISQIQES